MPRGLYREKLIIGTQKGDVLLWYKCKTLQFLPLYAHAWESQESERSLFLFLCIKLHIPIFFPHHFFNKKRDREMKAPVGTWSHYAHQANLKLLLDSHERNEPEIHHTCQDRKGF